MSQRYFELTEDMSVRGRWVLGTPTDLQDREVADPWIFKKGRPIPDPGRLRVPMDVRGKPLDFSLAGFATPIVHVRVASLLMEMAPDDVQIFPVDIEGHADQFCILVATQLVQCIDDAASDEVEYWKPEDGRPEKVGQYRKVSGLRIAPTRVGAPQVFRTWGWSVVLVVSERIKAALEALGATGTLFESV
ncbi:hypothetical protein MFUL124B02_22125 [Myxococcus fulvus 124B02]|nr:hypothetical protein MFUL124B02_22125 [Myxococcus fulvus 124B02]